jgi:hypothetical protein
MASDHARAQARNMVREGSNSTKRWAEVEPPCQSISGPGNFNLGDGVTPDVPREDPKTLQRIESKLRSQECPIRSSW